MKKCKCAKVTLECCVKHTMAEDETCRLQHKLNNGKYEK